MHGRMTRVQGSPERLQEAIDDYRTRVAEPASKLPGFKGCVLLVNRDTGEAASVTYWADEKALAESEAFAVQVRGESTEKVGSRVISVETAEIVDIVRNKPPQANTFIRLNSLEAAMDRLDSALQLYRSKVLPVLKAQPGFRAAICSINRERGKMIVSSVWDTAEDRAASEAQIANLRRETGQAAGGEVKVELFESAFSNIQVEVGARA